MKRVICVKSEAGSCNVKGVERMFKINVNGDGEEISRKRDVKTPVKGKLGKRLIAIT